MTSSGLYHIAELSSEDGQVAAVLKLNGGHWIFGVHFPGQSVLPAAVLLEILVQVCNKASGRQLCINKVSDARFRSTVTPNNTDTLKVEAKMLEDDGLCKVKASFSYLQGGEYKAASSVTAFLEPKAFPLCFLVPFYNNSKTVKGVIESINNIGYPVIAVCDGSTDGSLEEASAAKPYSLISYAGNKGKGYAIKAGIKKAMELGFRYAMVFDADGQHTISGALALIQKAEALTQEQRLRTIIIGSRSKRGSGSGGKFANNFSNFWLRVQTGVAIGDTQSGLRLYPLKKISRVKFLGRRYEFETEVIVRMVWRGFELLEVPVDVVYPKDRVSHFRKGADFTRISLMNTFLTFGAGLYGYPRMFFSRLFGR